MNKPELENQNNLTMPIDIQEEWRTLEYYNCGENTPTEIIKKYQVSNFGQIRNTITKRIIKSFKKNDEYLEVNIRCQTNVVKRIKVHRAVACTFIPNNNHTLVVNHKDLNKTNNNLNNLEWLTTAENTHHAIENGAVPQRKIEYADIVQIDKNTFEVINQFNSFQEANQISGVSSSLIKKVCNHNKSYYTAGGYIWMYLEEAREQKYL